MFLPLALIRVNHVFIMPTTYVRHSIISRLNQPLRQPYTYAFGGGITPDTMAFIEISDIFTALEATRVLGRLVEKLSERYKSKTTTEGNSASDNDDVPPPTTPDFHAFQSTCFDVWNPAIHHNRFSELGHIFIAYIPGMTPRDIRLRREGDHIIVSRNRFTESILDDNIGYHGVISLPTGVPHDETFFVRMKNGSLKVVYDGDRKLFRMINEDDPER